MQSQPRKYLRHPSGIPLYYRLCPEMEGEREQLRDIAQGGLSFSVSVPLPIGAEIEIEIQATEPSFKAMGTIVWCRERHDSTRFDVGVCFQEVELRHAVRMVEQICHIELYRRCVLAREGRHLSSEEAALEWIERFARHFPA